MLTVLSSPKEGDEGGLDDLFKRLECYRIRCLIFFH
jgi:hypothetical protein